MKGKNMYNPDHGNYKHGLCHKKIHKVWTAMRNRCKNPNHKQYSDYGGRGIEVCKEWDDFLVFFKDMGDVPDNMQIERIDNNGNYCKENCCWADRKKQSNNRRTTRYHIIDKKKITHQEMLKQSGLTKTQFRYRENKEKYKQNELVPRVRKGTFHDVCSCSRNKEHPLHKMYKSWGYIKTHSIGMCAEWEDFMKFVEDMGQKPENKRLLRRFTNEKFCKENCYWG